MLYMVSYDLKDDNYVDVIGAIQNMSNYKCERVLYSAYLMESEYSTSQILNEIRKFAAPGDNIIVNEFNYNHSIAVSPECLASISKKFGIS